MPQLIALALVGVGAWAIYKWLKGQTSQTAKDLAHDSHQQDDPSIKSPNRDAEDLEQDPDTGVFGPKD